MITTTLVTSLLSPSLLLGEPSLVAPLNQPVPAFQVAEDENAESATTSATRFSSHKFGFAASPATSNVAATAMIPSAPVAAEGPALGTLAAADHHRFDLDPQIVEDIAGDEPTLANADRDKPHWWSLHIAPGVMLILPLFGDYGQGIPAGPSIRFGGHVNRMFGNFYIGGGPVAHYTLFFASDGTGDRASAHIFTVGGDLFLGGGNEKIVGYGHISMGAGIFSFKAADGATSTRASLTGLGGRIAVGGGLHGFVTEKISVGFLADFIYPFGLDLFATVGIHFK